VCFVCFILLYQFSLWLLHFNKLLLLLRSEPDERSRRSCRFSYKCSRSVVFQVFHLLSFIRWTLINCARKVAILKQGNRRQQTSPRVRNLAAPSGESQWLCICICIWPIVKTWRRPNLKTASILHNVVVREGPSHGHRLHVQKILWSLVVTDKPTYRHENHNTSHNTIWYDMMRYDIEDIYVRPKANI